MRRFGYSMRGLFISINDSMLLSVCYTVIYMVRVWLGLG